MRFALAPALIALNALALSTSPLAAQAPVQSGTSHQTKSIAWSDLTGVWSGRSLRATSDSVITLIAVHFSSPNKISVTYPNRAPIMGRLISTGGDSVVFDYGPYESLTRAKHTVASVHNVLHLKGKRMTGGFIAKFDDGQSLTGRLELARK
ncbi:MAG TPA: hypothetical protein VN706_16135 [Gemmatimonadaceae bacterium]|nr:hypothetical protein [Gemmatimonadaceae bacterium]